LEIDVSIELRRAGTGGAVWHARDRHYDRFFLLNGDSWFDINLLDFAGRALSEPSATKSPDFAIARNVREAGS
jgi:NDP-sugar pyrophosphorylase family protein